MKLTILGSGTSTGVPQIGCHCRVCESTDPRDKRLRTSAILEVEGKRLLIDCGPDFREQIIRENCPDLDALLITHSHYDHVGGLDDLRPYCYKADGFPVYCTAYVDSDLRSRLPYCFTDKRYPGVPTFKMHTIDFESDFYIEGIKVTPLKIIHGKLPIAGYRIGNLAYITDCKTMPEETFDKLEGTEVLVINALRHEEHMSHMNLAQALDVVNRVNPKRAYLTHLSHDMGTHAATSAILPKGVEIATDGMTIIIDNHL